MKRKDGRKTTVIRPCVDQPQDTSIRFIPLTQGQLAIVDADDYGWLSQWNWCAHRHQDGRFYALRYERLPKKKFFKMHREILGCVDGELGDHINGDGLDNRRSNLRKANHAENSRNARFFRNNTSGFKGVGWMKEAGRRNGGRWYAYIIFEQKRQFLGYHPTPRDAAITYNEAAVRLHGEFASLNPV